MQIDSSCLPGRLCQEEWVVLFEHRMEWVVPFEHRCLQPNIAIILSKLYPGYVITLYLCDNLSQDSVASKAQLLLSLDLLLGSWMSSPAQIAYRMCGLGQVDKVHSYDLSARFFPERQWSLMWMFEVNYDQNSMGSLAKRCRSSRERKKWSIFDSSFVL